MEMAGSGRAICTYWQKWQILNGVSNSPLLNAGHAFTNYKLQNKQHQVKNIDSSQRIIETKHRNTKMIQIDKINLKWETLELMCICTRTNNDTILTNQNLTTVNLCSIRDMQMGFDS